MSGGNDELTRWVRLTRPMKESKELHDSNLEMKFSIFQHDTVDRFDSLKFADYMVERAEEYLRGLKHDGV